MARILIVLCLFSMTPVMAATNWDEATRKSSPPYRQQAKASSYVQDAVAKWFSSRRQRCDSDKGTLNTRRDKMQCRESSDSWTCGQTVYASCWIP